MRALFYAMLSLPLVAGAVSADRPQIYPRYESVFIIRQHVDGSPLLVDGRFEYYLFPDAKRERTPDRSTSCGTRIFVQSMNFVAGMIRSAARSRSR